MIGGRSALLSAASGLGYGNWAGDYEDVSLLLRNGAPALVLLDESPTPKTLTSNGSGCQITTGTFKYGSSAFLFDGAGWLTTQSNQFAFGTGDFTIEAWVRPQSTAQYQHIFSTRPGAVADASAIGLLLVNGTSVLVFSNANLVSGGTLQINAGFYHVALTRQGSSLRLFVDGQQVGSTATNTQNFTKELAAVGANANGSEKLSAVIDDLRVTKGVARYTSNFTPPAAELPANIANDPSYNNVSLLLKNGAPIGSLVPTDESPAPKVITVVGNAGISTTTFKYGDSSLVFDGNGDYLSTPYSPGVYDWWTSDFTAEAWVYANSWAGWSNTLTSAMLVHGSPTAGIVYWGFGPTTQGVLRFYWYNNREYSVQTSNLIPTGSWAHIAMVRTSEGIRLFINGKDPVGPRAQPALGTSSTSFPLLVGASAGVFANGYIDDLRITKGVARYTKNFLPPPAELPAI